MQCTMAAAKTIVTEWFLQFIAPTPHTPIEKFNIT